MPFDDDFDPDDFSQNLGLIGDAPQLAPGALPGTVDPSGLILRGAAPQGLLSALPQPTPDSGIVGAPMDMNAVSPTLRQPASSMINAGSAPNPYMQAAQQTMANLIKQNQQKQQQPIMAPASVPQMGAIHFGTPQVHQPQGSPWTALQTMIQSMGVKRGNT